jgi:hypothetical protein
VRCVLCGVENDFRGVREAEDRYVDGVDRSRLLDDLPMDMMRRWHLECLLLHCMQVFEAKHRTIEKVLLAGMGGEREGERGGSDRKSSKLQHSALRAAVEAVAADIRRKALNVAMVVMLGTDDEEVAMTMERRLLPLIAMASTPSDGALMMEGADKRHDLAAP